MPCPERFKDSLKDFGVEESIVNEINSGYEDIVSSSPKSERSAYFKRAVDIMDREVEPEKVRDILDSNCCCKSGSRLKASKAFAKENAALSLEEKLNRIEQVPYMGKPVLNSDGTITVHAVYYSDGEKYCCACSNFNKVKRDYPVSKTYCFCCAGHFRFHYEIMLGVKLTSLEIVSSPLDSDGKNPCIIKFKQNNA